MSEARALELSVSGVSVVQLSPPAARVLFGLPWEGELSFSCVWRPLLPFLCCGVQQISVLHLPSSLFRFGTHPRVGDRLRYAFDVMPCGLGCFREVPTELIPACKLLHERSSQTGLLSRCEFYATCSEVEDVDGHLTFSIDKRNLDIAVFVREA